MIKYEQKIKSSNALNFIITNLFVFLLFYVSYAHIPIYFNIINTIMFSLILSTFLILGIHLSLKMGDIFKKNKIIKILSIFYVISLSLVLSSSVSLFNSVTLQIEDLNFLNHWDIYKYITYMVLFSFSFLYVFKKSNLKDFYKINNKVSALTFFLFILLAGIFIPAVFFHITKYNISLNVFVFMIKTISFLFLFVSILFLNFEFKRVFYVVKEKNIPKYINWLLSIKILLLFILYTISFEILL